MLHDGFVEMFLVNIGEIKVYNGNGSIINSGKENDIMAIEMCLNILEVEDKESFNRNNDNHFFLGVLVKNKWMK